MAIAFRSILATLGLSGTATKTANKPAGVVVGDLLVAVVCVGAASTANITPPAGWTACGAKLVLAASEESQMFYKIAGGSEPATYDFTLSTGTNYTDIQIARYDGVDQSTPLDAYGQASFASVTTTPATPSITTGRNGALIVTVFENTNFGLGATTPPTGETERAKSDNAVVWNDETQATAGASGAKTETCGSGKWLCHIVSFNAAAGGHVRRQSLTGGLPVLNGGI